MKKILPVIVAVVLIIVIAAAGFGAKLLERYSYSKERADLTEYFGIDGSDDVPIILQDEQIEEHAKIFDNICYFDIATVHKYFNERFYEDKSAESLLYTVPDAIYENPVGTGTLKSLDADFSESQTDYDYTISRYEGDVLYIAADYVKQYANFSYELFTNPNHMQIYTEWGSRETATIKKDTQVRYQGGVKSEILTDVSKGDKVVVLEEMETWTKVKTEDSFIGYVENKRLEEKTEETPEPVTDYVEPEYKGNTRDYKINLGWHVIGGVDGNSTLDSAVAQTKGLNVISPTWFTLMGNEGDFNSFATTDYVEKAHGMGLEVWALLGNVDSIDVDMYEVLGKTENRRRLIQSVVAVARDYGIDGLNIDFENLGLDAGEPFVQFIRELSIPCRKYGIVLSVDNYVPMSHTDHYNRAEQGVVADYVIIMGYDEHYNGSDEAGSVASINFVESGIQNTVAEVAPEKVINALPFYTRIWETKGTELASQAVGMETAAAFVADHGIATRWDETTCQNYGELQEGDTLYQVWLEDAESIKVKLNIMEKYGVAGVAAWRLGFETADIWDTIEQYMNQS